MSCTSWSFDGIARANVLWGTTFPEGTKGPQSAGGRETGQMFFREVAW